MLPWPVSVIVWYVLSLVCLFLAVHWISAALEVRIPRPFNSHDAGWLSPLVV